MVNSRNSVIQRVVIERLRRYIELAKDSGMGNPNLPGAPGLGVEIYFNWKGNECEACRPSAVP